ncbi:MAG: cytochrome P450 [Dehalococcoidia bacterium]
MTMTADKPNLTLEDINLIEPRIFGEKPPHDQWKLLREQDPVRWHDGWQQTEDGEVAPFRGFWSITKYDDIIRISRDPETFISSRGIVIGTEPESATAAAGLGKMLITMDPPRHVRLRRLVNKGFTPRAVVAFESEIRRYTSEILDDFCQKDTCDFVTEVAAILPLAVICGMMGIAKEDWGKMFALTNKVLGASDPEFQDEVAGDIEDVAERRRVIEATVMQGNIEMFQYFGQSIAAHREAGKDDLVQTLIDSKVDGEPLTDEEILFFCYLLILAGNETTRNAISGGMLAFFENPDQLQKLRANPALLPSATEEILRYISPVTHMTRAATRDTELRGKQIKTGDKVALWYPSANRDAHVFPDADTFNIERSPNDHLAFGIGEHFCLGAGFARMEISVMFEELLKRFSKLEQDGPAERLASNFIGGIKHMPVKYTRA